MKLLVEWGQISRILDPGTVYLVGRDQGSDLQIDFPRISRNHLRIEFLGEFWNIKDLDSSNGTFFGRKQIKSINIEKETTLNLGDRHGISLRLIPLENFQKGENIVNDFVDKTQLIDSKFESQMDSSFSRIKLGERIRIGRDLKNDWSINDLTVSRFHAEILSSKLGDFYITDLKSENGTFVNGKSIKRHNLSIGDVITVGHTSRKFTQDGLEGSGPNEGTEIFANQISYQVGEKVLLQPASFKLGTRTLTAIIGPSGAGKSTLLNTLTGRVSLTSGKILIGGRDLETDYSKLKNEIGLVPQADIIHTKLTVRQALNYGAALRLPKDVSKSERDERVNQILDKLELTPRADLQVFKLSGGQKKRVSIGLELLTKPELLVLDEPTSGLDPGLDAHVMETLRTLADDGQTIVVVTHAVENLNFCDNVILIGSGGRLAYFGPPSTIFKTLGKSNWAEIFKLLADNDATFLQVAKNRFNVGDNQKRAIKESAKRQNWIKQCFTLSSRYASVIKADRFYMFLLFAVPVIMGLISYFTSSKWGFAPGPITEAGFRYNPTARSSVMVLVLGSMFIALSTSVQEFVKERDIFLREKNVGVRVSAYFFSKFFTLFVIVSIQLTIFMNIVLFKRPQSNLRTFFGSSINSIFVITIILGVCSLLIGLIISSFISTTEQSMPALVGVTMIQIVLSGILPIESGKFISKVSALMPSFMATNAYASVTDLAEITFTQSKSLLTRWSPTSGNMLLMLVELTLLSLLFALISLYQLQKKSV